MVSPGSLLRFVNRWSGVQIPQPAPKYFQTTEDFSVVQAEGVRRVRRHVKHYNLDAIISVGYRVNSRRGVRFRQWATSTLREHLGGVKP